MRSMFRGCSAIIVMAQVSMLVVVIEFSTLTAAWATGYAASVPVMASAASPFASCTADDVASQAGTNYPDTAWAPSVAVNPTNALNVVGTWLQDKWSDPGARGIVAGVSTDGGATWTQVPIPGLTKCAEGDYDRSQGSWVAFAPNGDLYLAGISFDLGAPFGVHVSKSTDGGFSWGSPTFLHRDDSNLFGNRFPTIAVDPRDPRFVYQVWTHLEMPAGDQPNEKASEVSHAFRGDIMLARTTDGGFSWEPGRAIYAPLSNYFAQGNHIAVLPDGSLVVVFDLIQSGGSSGQPNHIAVVRSTDHGQTWSKPIIVSEMRSAGVADPETGQPVSARNAFPDIGVDPVSGAIYVVWGDARFSGKAGIDSIVLSKSTDGGLHWSAPVAINQTPSTGAARNQQAFRPTVEVASDGSVGVTYYDFRNNTADPATLPTDYWFIHSHDGGATWSETHVAGPFDLAEAPVVFGGLSLGDSQGLATAGTAFRALFGQSGASSNALDVFFSSIGP